MENLHARITAFNENRIDGLLKIKYEGMAENLFRFFRATNFIFYEDLLKTVLPHAPLARISGDLHLENFGSYKSDNRLVYFDLNDFDDSMLAPAVWELYRVITSIFIAFQSLKIEEKKAMNMATLFLKNYAATLAGGKPDYIEPATAKGIVGEFLQAVCKRKQKDILAKRTEFKKTNLPFFLMIRVTLHWAMKKRNRLYSISPVGCSTMTAAPTTTK